MEKEKLEEVLRILETRQQCLNSIDMVNNEDVDTKSLMSK